MNYEKKLWLLIAFSTIARLTIASTTALGNDEVYYYTYALHLQSNYFDHPPVVGWLIRVTTANLLLHSELFVRLGSVVSSAICTSLVYKTGVFISNSQTGWYAALLYTSSLYCSIIAGIFIMPDSPQMVFWLLSILLLLKISKLPVGCNKAIWLWLLFGIAAGLCIMSKVHGIFLWIAAALYVLFLEPGWLKYKIIYLSAIISLVIISPIIIWNFRNHFISYAYHGSRVSLVGSGIHADGFIRELGGEIFYNNPLNFFLIWRSVFAAFKGKLAADKKHITLLLFCGLPLIFTLLIVSLFKDTLPHWSGPGYNCLIILGAIQLTPDRAGNDRTPAVINAALIFICAIIITATGIIHFYPGTLSGQKQGMNMGEGDPTLDMYGWDEAGTKINALYTNDTAQHIIPAYATIVVDNWFPAAHIDFYIASKTRQQTYAIGNVFNLHHYYWLNQYKKKLAKGDAAYYIVPSNLYKQEAIDTMKKRFDTMSLASVIPQYRSGVICRNFFVYRLRGFH